VVLQCLNSYTELSPSPESMKLLRMIMAQVLSVVVLSFKAMTGKRISELTLWIPTFLADYEQKRL
jgi:hypothetical protein